MRFVTRQLSMVFVLLSVVSLLLLGSMPASVRSASVSTGTSVLNGDQEWESPCYGAQVAVDPTSPTTHHDVQVTAYGNWPNTCVPVYQSHEMIGNVIRVNANANESEVCLLIITPWQLAVDLGNLPSGSYEARIYITDFHTYITDVCATAAFHVFPSILITGVYYDAYASGQPDEAFRLQNVSGSPVDLTGWTVTDKEGTLTLQDTLDAGDAIWVACEAHAFAGEFGFDPDYEYCDETDPTVPNLVRSDTFSLNDGGDEIVVANDSAVIVDQVIFESGDPIDTGWSGPPVQPYGPTTALAKKGQILYRMLDQSTGLPVTDTDTASDWAQSTDDNVNGKKVQYPGWDLEEFFFPETFTEAATLTYAVAPDNIYDAVLAEINQATTSIFYEGYTFKNAHLADAIVARMTAYPGMTVRVLLEGEAVGGITDQEKWICQQIENAGGEVYFMFNDSDGGVHDRYNYQHGKWMVIDGDTLLTGSENLNYSSMPADDKADGTEGNRGVWLITDAPSAIAHAMEVFEHDLDPEDHKDLFRWTALDPTYGAPTPGFTPDYASGGTSYAVQFPTPLTMGGTFSFEMVQSPENSLRDSDSLLGMVARAGSGDTVLVEQLYEYTFWGPTTSNPTDDPNLRLEAYNDAARRGAQVRILLDSVFDDPGSVRGNTATCTYVNGLASSEGLDLECKLANPTGAGIHNKMVLVNDGGQGYVHTGSINGSENSSKNNREFAVQVQSNDAYTYLAGVFWYDWAEQEEEHFVFLPLVMRGYPSLPYQPTLYAISNTDGDGSYTVSWTELPERRADTYTLEEATDSTFTTGLRTVCTTAHQSCPVSGRVAGTYYYRVRGQNVFGYSPYSNGQSASVLLPATPTLYAIENGDGDGNYTVSWSSAARATWYRLQEDTDPNFSSPTTLYEGPNLSWSATNKTADAYGYRVMAVGPTGSSSWSIVRSAIVLLPGTPWLNPIDNADGDGDYTVSWNSAARATSYTLQEDTVSDFADPTTRYDGVDLSTSFTNKPLGTYYYRVRAIGPTGQSPWSNVRSVTVSPSNLRIENLIYDARDERLIIHNSGAGPQLMTGWWVHSVVGNQEFPFPNDYTLAAGATVTIHTGPDANSDPPAHLLWTTAYIWSNDGDKAVLYDDSNQVIDSYCYLTGCP